MIKFLQVPEISTSIFNKRFDDFLNEFEETMNSIEPGEYLVCEQREYHVSQKFSEIGNSELLFDGVMDRVLLLRSLLSRLSGFSRSIYMFDGHCVDENFEVALACGKIFCFNPDVYAGFRCFYYGGFPCLGVLENLILKRALGKFLLNIEERPVISAQEMVVDGILDLAIRVDDPKKFVCEWIKDYGETQGDGQPKSLNVGGRSFLRRRSRKNIIELDNGSPITHGCLGFLRKLKSIDDVGNEIARISLRYLFSFRFHGDFFSYAKEVLPQGEAIYISVFGILPPSDFLMRVIDSKLNLVFVSPDVESLSGAMEIMASRVEKVMDREGFSFLWAKKVFWIIGTSVPVGGFFVEFLADHRVLLSRNEQNIDIQLITETRSMSSKIGEIDALHPQLKYFDNSWLNVVCGKLVRFPKISRRVSLCVFVRSLFFQELVRVCSKRSISFSSVCELLGDNGWRFAASLSEWDKFLGLRHSSIGYDCRNLQLGSLKLDSAIWELSTIREVEVFIGKRLETRDIFPLSLSSFCDWLMELVLFYVRRESDHFNIYEVGQLIVESMGYPLASGFSYRQRNIFNDCELLGIESIMLG